MTIAVPALSDIDVQRAVQDELAWTPEVDAAGIGVAVGDGVVSLSGEVDKYLTRTNAKRAALRVHGVSAVVDDMTVHPHWGPFITEHDVARVVDHALLGASDVPATVKAEIRGHHVTLVGAVEWNFERGAAARVVRNLSGVDGVSDMITLTPRVSSPDTARHIRHAISRNAQIGEDAITVVVSGNVATLTGTVGSVAQLHEAERAAWASPYISEVRDRMVVRPSP